MVNELILKKNMAKSHVILFFIAATKINIYICEQSSNFLYLQSKQSFRKLNL